MRFRMHGCGPRGFDFPEGLFAMGFGPRGGGWGSGWSGWDSDWGGSGRGRRGRRRVFEPGELRTSGGAAQAETLFDVPQQRRPVPAPVRAAPPKVKEPAKKPPPPLNMRYYWP